MLLRRATPLAFAIAAIACEPSVPFDPASHNPATVDYAVFDPAPDSFDKSPADIPLPNDLAFQPDAIATQPAAQAEVLTSFAKQGGWPADQDLPVTFDFVRITIDPATGASTRSAPDLDVASINAGNLIILSLSASSVAPVAYETPIYTTVDPSTGKPMDHGLLIVNKKKDTAGLRHWAPSVYVAAIKGGPNGIRTKAAGTPFNPRPAMYLITQGVDLSRPENQALISCDPPVPCTRAMKAAKGAQLETLRKAYLLPFAALAGAGFATSDIVNLTAFTVTSGVRIVADPIAAGLGQNALPFPSDFLLDPVTHHLIPAAQDPVHGPFKALGPALGTLDGFSTTALITAGTSGLIDPATVNKDSVFLYEIGTVPPTALPKRVPEAAELATGAKPGWVAASAHLAQLAGLSSINVIALQPGVPIPVGTSLYPLPPLKEGTEYAVVLTDKITEPGGKKTVQATLGRLLSLNNALLVGTTPTVAGLALADAKQLEPLRQLLKPVLDDLAATKGVTRDHVTMVYTIRTQSGIKGTAAQLAALPYADQTGNLTVPAGATTSFYCGGTALANTAVCATAGTIAGAFNDFGTDPAVAPNGNIGYVIDTAMTTFNKLLCKAGDATCHDTGAFNPNPDPASAFKETISVLIALPQPGTPSFAGGCIPGASGNSPNGVCTLPLVVFRHGLNGGRASMLGVADRLTAAGFAVAAIDANKHGDRAYCNPLSTTPQCVGDTPGSPSAFCTPDPAVAGEGEPAGAGPGHCAAGHDYQRRPAPAGCATCTQTRAIPLASGNYLITPNLFRSRDTLRQDIIDESALARVLSPNPACDKAQPPTNLAATCANQLITAATGVQIDPKKIYYLGSSLGAIQGAANVAANPRFAAATLNAGGATIVDTFTDPDSGLSSSLAALLAALGIAPGSSDYLQFLTVAKWVLDPADPINFAAPGLTDPLLKSPLIGNAQVPSRPVLGQMALCDNTVTNTWNANLYTRLGLGTLSATKATLTTFVAGGLPAPTCPANAVHHGFLGDWTTYGQGAASITQQAQDDIANFFKDPVNNLPPPVRTTP